MKLNKKFLAVLAVGALSAATAVPALALENEFHGMFQSQYINSNFNRSQNTPGNFDFYNPVGKDKKAPTANLFEQRARLMYIAKANDNLKLVTHFEIDYALWGNSSYGLGRNGGGALGADQVNLETKSIYLDFNIPATPVNVKVGMQPVTDSFKGFVFDADMAGVLASAATGNLNTSVGYFRWDDTGAIAGKNSRDFLMLDAKYNLSKDIKVGGAYYFINSDNADLNHNPTNKAIDDLTVHMLGVNGEATFGPVVVDGFFAYQFGSDYLNKKHRSAFAGNVGAKIKVGPGTARTEFIYASGEGDNARSTTNAFYSVQSLESGYYNNEMVILGRDKFAMTTDNSIVMDVNNQNQGVIGGYVGYDLPINQKLSAAANLGFAAVAKDNGTFGLVHKSNYLGTEMNAEMGYKLYENLTATVRGAYVVLGDYFKDVASNGTPDNPYDVKLILRYTF